MEISYGQVACLGWQVVHALSCVVVWSSSGPPRQSGSTKAVLLGRARGPAPPWQAEDKSQNGCRHCKMCDCKRDHHEDKPGIHLVARQSVGRWGC